MSGGNIEIISSETDVVQDGLVLALGVCMRELDEIKDRIATLVTALAAKREVVLLVE